VKETALTLAMEMDAAAVHLCFLIAVCSAFRSVLYRRPSDYVMMCGLHLVGHVASCKEALEFCFTIIFFYYIEFCVMNQLYLYMLLHACSFVFRLFLLNAMLQVYDDP
jgi:hypothetical protein